MNRSFKFLKYFILLTILLSSVTDSAFSRSIEKKIIILQFTNNSGAELDYLNEIIQNSLFVFFNIAPNYNPIDIVSFKTFLKNNYYSEGDLQNNDILLKIARSFSTKEIIRGEYSIKDDFLVIDFEVMDTKKKKIIYRSSKFGKSGINIINTIDNTAKSMVQDFTGIILNFASIKAITDKRCKLYVDDTYYGTTPSRINVVTGKHKVEIVYEEKGTKINILRKMMNILKDEEIELKVNVFTKVLINSDKKCDVYIDNKKVGQTPFETKLYTGNFYKLRLVFVEDNKKKIIFDEYISTINKNKLDLKFN